MILVFVAALSVLLGNIAWSYCKRAEPAVPLPESIRSTVAPPWLFIIDLMPFVIVIYGSFGSDRHSTGAILTTAAIFVVGAAIYLIHAFSLNRMLRSRSDGEIGPHRSRIRLQIGRGLSVGVIFLICGIHTWNLFSDSGKL